MAKFIKLIRKYMRRIQRKPWMLWALGGGLAVAVVALGLVLVLALRPEKVPTFGENTTSITLVAGGDLNVTDNTVASGVSGNGYDYTTPFLDVAQIFAEADGAFLNFEGNLCGEPYGSAAVSAPNALVQALAACGVDFLQVANSCPVKNGILGLQQTLTNIRNCGMEPLGAYASNAEAAREQGFLLRDIGGVRVAIVAFTKGMDGMALPENSKNCVNVLYEDYESTYQKLDRDRINKILDAAAAEKPDLTIAMLHWGSEFNDTFSASQNAIVELMQQKGVDAIIGTHPHYVQQMTLDQESGMFIAYSLGDFFGDATKGGTEYSVILDLEITKNNETGETKITNFSFTPIFTVSDEGKLRVVRIAEAMTAYDGDYLGKISREAYEKMGYALDRITDRTGVPSQPSESTE